MATVTLHGNPYHTTGKLPKVGAWAPEFIVTKTDLSEIRSSNYIGKRFILNIFPSLDTPTCAQAMKHFNDIAIGDEDLLILCVSADLPFAQKRFCSDQHLDNVQPVSTFRHPEFGTNYGVTITEGPLKGLLARCIVVIDESGKVIYLDLISEITKEPNYEKLLQAIK